LKDILLGNEVTSVFFIFSNSIFELKHPANEKKQQLELKIKGIERKECKILRKIMETEELLEGEFSWKHIVNLELLHEELDCLSLVSLKIYIFFLV
jgi:hypothetical protein